ncbi:MAG: SAM-dependent methyltransferase [Treponema sp.]|nr:SAM-dependent methyltransferase [Treponema sp.]
MTDELTSIPFEDIIKISFSLSSSEVTKAVVKPILLKNEKVYQCETFTGKKAFHQNIPLENFPSFMKSFQETHRFKNIHVNLQDEVIAYRISKKGEVHRTKTSRKVTETQHLVQNLSHDREKQYIITEGMTIPALVDLGVFTADHRVVKAKYHKYRQINNFLKNIEETLRDENPEGLHIVEYGSGKSYLTFFLHYYFTEIKKIPRFSITGYDLNGETIALCQGLAEKYRLQNCSFIAGDAAQMSAAGADMMITLHACDTATDHALFNAIQARVKYIFSVPCCQQEINGRIGAAGEFAILLRQGLYKERFSALLTDTIRCEILRGAGYQVDVVEFVGEENTPKNAMIRARYTGHKADTSEEVKALLGRFGVSQCLVDLMERTSHGGRA